MILASAYLFRDLSQRALEAISQIAVEESHLQEAFLFQSGDSAQYLYILQEGRVRLSVVRTGHLAHIISEPGEAIGWSSMAGNGQYTASAQCLVPVRVLRIEHGQLNAILENDPTSGLTFFRQLAILIGKRLAESYSATLSVQAAQDPRSYG